MFVDRSVTITYFHRSADVYQTLSGGVMASFHKGNALLERGILAELDQKPDIGLFRSALSEYERMGQHLRQLGKDLDELLAIERANKRVPVYVEALAGIIREDRPFERVSNTGTRFALAGDDRKAQAARLDTAAEIVAAQREDLGVLVRKHAVMIESLRAAIPLAERSEFVPVMLSGRNAFGDVMPQFTDMVSAFDRFYARSCMATITATMQVYPAGFEWLPKLR